MKFKTTVKNIKENYGKNLILEIGYCDLQNLLTYDSPKAYTCGVYGWNFDLYEINGVAICTGYRGMPAGKNFDYSLVHKYDDKARAIMYADKPETMTWERFIRSKQNKIKKLQERFLKEVYKN